MQDSLSRLGFHFYGDYLKSDLWKTIRSQVLQRDGHKCVRCQKAANQVHHEAYDIQTLSGKCLQRLKSSCGKCHRQTHRRNSSACVLKPLTEKQKKHQSKLKARAAWKYQR